MHQVGDETKVIQFLSLDLGYLIFLFLSLSYIIPLYLEVCFSL